MTMNTLDAVRNILIHELQLGGRGADLGADSPLLGALPELDSIAVANLIGALEDAFGFVAHDDEISADTFSTLGQLSAFVDAQVS